MASIAAVTLSTLSPIARIGHAFAAADDMSALPPPSSATTTTASVLAPRLMVKEPAIGQLSVETVRLRGGIRCEFNLAVLWAKIGESGLFVA